MSEFSQFLQWVRNDRGTPIPLVPLRIPRLLTSIPIYVIAGVLAYFAMDKSIHDPSQREALRHFVHSSWILLAYFTFFWVWLLNRYLNFKYPRTGSGLPEQIHGGRRDRHDIVVKVHITLFVLSSLLFLIGALEAGHYLEQ